MSVARLFSSSSKPSRRRMVAAVVPLATAALLLGAGCSSSDDSSSSTTTAATTATTSAATTAPATTAAAAGSLSAEDEAAITTAFTEFFDGSSPAETKLSHLQDSANFTAAVDAQAESGLAMSTTATVTAISETAPGVAAVTYTIEMGGSPVLPDQGGVAVQVDGEWKMSASTFCNLLTLQAGGVAPAECVGVEAPTAAVGN